MKWRWDEWKKSFYREDKRVATCIVVATLNENEIELERLRKDKGALRHLYHRLSELRMEYRKLLNEQN